MPSEKDANVSGMEIETKPDITYEQIGGLEEQIIEVKENKKQYLDLLLLADEQEDFFTDHYDTRSMSVGFG